MDLETEESASCNAEQLSAGDFDADDDYIARLQQAGAWDEDIDAELSKLLDSCLCRRSVTVQLVAREHSTLRSLPLHMMLHALLMRSEEQAKAFRQNLFPIFGRRECTVQFSLVTCQRG